MFVGRWGKVVEEAGCLLLDHLPQLSGSPFSPISLPSLANITQLSHHLNSPFPLLPFFLFFFFFVYTPRLSLLYMHLIPLFIPVSHFFPLSWLCILPSPFSAFIMHLVWQQSTVSCKLMGYNRKPRSCYLACWQLSKHVPVSGLLQSWETSDNFFFTYSCIVYAVFFTFFLCVLPIRAVLCSSATEAE